MTIYDMIPGYLYLATYSYGSCVVEMISKQYDPLYDYETVKVRYLNSGLEDTWLEMPNSMFVACVEPYSFPKEELH